MIDSLKCKTFFRIIKWYCNLSIFQILWNLPNSVKIDCKLIPVQCKRYILVCKNLYPKNFIKVFNKRPQKRLWYPLHTHKHVPVWYSITETFYSLWNSLLGAPSKKNNGIFSDIVQKGGRGSSSNHLFKCLRKNDKLQGGGGPPGCCHYLIS